MEKYNEDRFLLITKEQKMNIEFCFREDVQGIEADFVNKNQGLNYLGLSDDLCDVAS